MPPKKTEQKPQPKPAPLPREGGRFIRQKSGELKRVGGSKAPPQDAPTATAETEQKDEG